MSSSKPLADIDAARWHRIEAILDRALELPAEQISDYLRSECGTDAGLREQIEALLRADARTKDLLAASAGTLIGGWLAEDDAPEPQDLSGRRIGAWRVEREIGRGGMGAVYLAARADGAYEQRVALKLVKRGLDTDEILRRFMRERRILAGLQHRHIARLLDGGVTEDGLPWFAMEYVEGSPITQWCEQHRAGLRERLRLFAEVAEAVGHAHRNLVVHRDLKPSNIFVTTEGEVRLLDFGIARFLGGEDAEGTLTGGAHPALTPHYAAPEQLRAEPATTATDIFSLGVVLYELLTGLRPFAHERTSVESIRRAVLEEEPSLPSASGQRLLRGDLDNITMMALRKEPEGRYPSVEALLADLDRYRDGQPVRATRASLSYRLAKFVRRNQPVVIAGAVAFLLLLAGVFVMQWRAFAAGLVVASLLGGLMASLWLARVARREARKAQEVKRFLLGVFEVSDPSQARGESVTARELLDQGARRIETELKDQPEVRAELVGVLGDLHLKLGLAESGLRMVERELALVGSLRGAGATLRAAALHRRGCLLLLKGAWSEAEASLREAADLHRASAGENSPLYAEDLDQLAGALRLQARLPEAKALAQRSLEIRRALYGRSHAAVAVSLNNLAVILRETGDLTGAEACYRECLRVRREALPADHPDVCGTLTNLAVLLRQLGRYEEAEQAAREAVLLSVKLYGEDHAITAGTQSILGAVLQSLGRYEQAEEAFRAALRHWEAHGGSEHPNAAASLNNLAGVLRDKGEFEAAEPLQRRAVERWRALLGDRHPAVASGLVNLAAILRERGELEEAEGLLADALRIRREQHGDDHPEVGNVLYQRAMLAARRNDLEAASEGYDRALAIRMRHLGPSNPATAACQTGRAAVWRRQGRREDALRELHAALETLRRALPPAHPDIALAESELRLAGQAIASPDPT